MDVTVILFRTFWNKPHENRLKIGEIIGERSIFDFYENTLYSMVKKIGTAFITGVILNRSAYIWYGNVGNFIRNKIEIWARFDLEQRSSIIEMYLAFI